MNVADARKGALKIAGRIAADRIEPGKRSAAKFADAMDEYLAHLVRQSERRGKPARWAKNVRSLSRLYLLPQWGKWPLAEMSGSTCCGPRLAYTGDERCRADNGKPLRPDYARLL